MEKAQDMNDQKKKAIIEHLWLTYYNDTLLAKGVITEAQHNKMRVMVNRRTTARA